MVYFLKNIETKYSTYTYILLTRFSRQSASFPLTTGVLYLIKFSLKQTLFQPIQENDIVSK